MQVNHAHKYYNVTFTCNMEHKLTDYMTDLYI